jgi:hypothetical protein
VNRGVEKADELGKIPVSFITLVTGSITTFYMYEFTGFNLLYTLLFQHAEDASSVNSNPPEVTDHETRHPHLRSVCCRCRRGCRRHHSQKHAFSLQPSVGYRKNAVSGLRSRNAWGLCGEPLFGQLEAREI